MRNDFLIFKEEEKVNIELIDNQHLKMSSIINNIYQSIHIKNYEEVLSQFIQLLNLLKTHFEYEESLMKETKFSGYYSHKLEHDRFYRKVEAIVHNLKTTNSLLSNEELNSIKNWFHNHIEISDKKCGVHFVAMGIK